MSTPKKVEGIRRQIADRRAALRALAAAPVPREEALARLDAWLESRRAAFVEDLFAVERLTDPEPIAAPAILGGLVVYGGNGRQELSLEGVEAALIALAGPELRKLLVAAVDNHLATAQPRPLAGRDDERERLEAEVLELEREEVAAVEAAEAAGYAVTRRSDADPRALLGLRD